MSLIPARTPRGYCVQGRDWHGAVTSHNHNTQFSASDSSHGLTYTTYIHPEQGKIHTYLAQLSARRTQDGPSTARTGTGQKRSSWRTLFPVIRIAPPSPTWNQSQSGFTENMTPQRQQRQKQQLPLPPAVFTSRKRKILQQLSVPDNVYTDASPKGSVDVGIRELIDELNAIDGFVTTSSCAGRVSVFLEGVKAPATTPSAPALTPLGEESQPHTQTQTLSSNEDAGNALTTIAGPGGKGGGGTWLFVSHDPLHESYDSDDKLLRLLGLVDDADVSRAGSGKSGSAQPGQRRRRLIHFKFEPMILHVLTASSSHAQLLLKCALAAGFRESGALNLLPAPTPAGGESAVTPIVGVRTMGLGLESLIGFVDDNGSRHCTVSADYLRDLVHIANERFIENAARIDRFRSALQGVIAGPPAKLGEGGGEWEDAAARRERKIAEGLRRKEEILVAKQKTQDGEGTVQASVEVPQHEFKGF